jgi:predicted DNA-binding transcriptional regulator YafY
VVVDQTHYLVATFWHYADLKQLAIHRIEAAQILDTPTLTPEDFDLQTYVDSGAFGYPEGEELLPLRALFAPDPARQFEETPLSDGQRLSEQADGRILLEAQVRDTAQLRWWLQGFGAQVEILGPPSLREEFAEQVRQLAGRYGVC